MSTSSSLKVVVVVTVVLVVEAGLVNTVAVVAIAATAVTPACIGRTGLGYGWDIGRMACGYGLGMVLPPIRMVWVWSCPRFCWGLGRMACVSAQARLLSRETWKR